MPAEALTMHRRLAAEQSGEAASAAATPALRILFLMDEMEAITAGGTERQVLQLIDLAKQCGFQPQLCMLRGTHWLTHELAGCPIRHLDLDSITSAQGLQSLAQLARWMKKESFDLVLTFFVDANIFGPIVARIAGVPVILGTRRNLNGWLKGPKAFLQTISNRFATRIVANSEAVRAAVAATERTAPEKIDVLYNGIDLAQFRRDPSARMLVRRTLNIPDDALLVGNLSALRPAKGTEIFVEAAGHLATRLPHLHFMLVGGGPLFPRLEARVRELGLTSRFHLAGAQEDVVPYLNAFDIAVLSSEAEGFSNSILEYMAMRLPTIATAVGGNAFALKGGCGIVVPPADLDQLTAAIERLVHDPGLRTRLAARAHARVQDFGLSATKETFRNYLLRITAQRSAR